MASKAGASWLASLVAVLLGAGVAWAGSQGSETIADLPVFALAVAAAFVIQWIAFVPSYLLQSEHFFDLTGSLTYMSVTALALLGSGATDTRSLIMAGLVFVWAGRLGMFLFRRVRKAGKDDRFTDIKRSAPRLFMTWTLQGLWVSLTLAAALGAMTSTTRVDLGAFAVVGFAVWALGFSMEVVADREKRLFRSDAANKGRFITTGLWGRSRHPNYFGEIVLWVGMALIAFPALEGWQLVTLVSPIFVFVLLTRVSGVPLLEKRADEKWGGEPEYEEYKRNTPVLVPRLGKSNGSPRS